MAYEVVFPSERVERAFHKILDRIPAEYQAAVIAREGARLGAPGAGRVRIVEAMSALAAIPRPERKRSKRLKGQVVVSQFTARYRLRIGPYRILYDIDDTRKKVIVLALLKRDEHTYN